VKQKYVVEFVQQSKVPAILLKRTGPELEEVRHRDLASTAPIADARELDKTLRTPGDEKEEIVVLIERNRLDCRRVPEPKSLANAIDQPVEVTLDIMTVVWRQNGIQVPRQIVVDTGRDDVGIIALRNDATELVSLCKVRLVSRIELRGNEGSSVQVQLLHGRL